MITGSQIRAARSLLDLTQDQLAEMSGVSKPTIARLELARDTVGGYASTRDKLVAALQGAGVAFLADGESSTGGPGVRLRTDRV